MDIAGIDVLAHVMRNLGERLPGEADRAVFATPPHRRGIDCPRRPRGEVRQGLLRTPEERSRKPRSGRLIRRQGGPPRSNRRGLPRSKPAKSIDDIGERVKTLFNAKDKAGEFLRATLAPTLVYTARVMPEIAHSIDDVDRAMRWGFGWDLGPFELFDAIGVKDVLAAAEGTHAMAGGVPPLSPACSKAGLTSFREGHVKPAAADLQILRTAREQNRVIKKNGGASLVDLGDGVIAIEFHSKMNAIGGDTIQMLQAGVKEAAKGGQAIVIERRAELLRRRQPDAGAAGGAGRQLGRDRSDGPRLPAGHDVAGTARAGWRRPRAWRSAAAPRFRCTAIACRPPLKPTWAWSKSASA